VRIETDLNITGRVAQFGRGALADVSQKLIGQFADRLETDVLAGNGTTAPPAGAPADDLGEPVPADAAAASTASTDEPAPAESPQPAPDQPAVRTIDTHDAAPVDLIQTAGAPLAKRLVPAVLAALFVLFLLRRRSRRR
jgi:hypothetical protein